MSTYLTLICKFHQYKQKSYFIDFKKILIKLTVCGCKQNKMLKTFKKKIKKIIKISDAISKNKTSQKRKNWETCSNYNIVPAAYTMQSVAHIYYIYNYSKYNSVSIYSNFMNVQ